MHEVIRKNWRYLIIAPLFFTALLTAHIKQHEMAFFIPEVILAYITLLFLGIVLGFFMTFGRPVLRNSTLTLLLILLILSQISFIPVLPYHLTYVLTLFFTAILYLTIAYCLPIFVGLDKLLLIFFSVVWVGAFFVKGIPFSLEQKFIQNTAVNKELPPYIEIVLDEHIGLIGDDKNGLLDNLSNHYIQKGFRVYSKAYSREKATIASFASFLNFKPLEQLDEYLFQEKKNKNSILKNRLFSELTKKGYGIHVLQTDYLNLCDNKKDVNFISCITYRMNDLNQTRHFKGTGEKLVSLLSSVFHAFHLNPMIVKVSNNILATRLNLPRNLIPDFPFSSSGYKIFPQAIRIAEKVEKGHAYFIHILLPHSPYVFDKNCQYSRIVGNETQAYFNQVQCVHKMMNGFLKKLSKNPKAKNSTIVIHGDHGSRIKPACQNSEIACTNDGLINNYSTFFIVRSPLFEPGKDMAQWSLDELLENIALGKVGFSSHAQQTFVNLRREDKNLSFLKKTPLFLPPQSQLNSEAVAVS